VLRKRADAFPMPGAGLLHEVVAAQRVIPELTADSDHTLARDRSANTLIRRYRNRRARHSSE
jgi:hypothetical protein